MLAYVGPDTLLPVTSGIAGALGFVMLFGRRIRDVAAAFVRVVRGARG